MNPNSAVKSTAWQVLVSEGIREGCGVSGGCQDGKRRHCPNNQTREVESHVRVDCANGIPESLLFVEWGWPGVLRCREPS